MKELTNEEIARVFAMYMPCEFIYEEEINNLVAVGNGWIYSDEADESGEGVFGTEDCKLLLTPLSAITDEHAIGALIVYGHNEGKAKDLIGRKYSQGFDIKLLSMLDSNTFQYLIQNGYSVPLFFGINHWANGKTAIELGLAVDSTTLKPAKP